MPFRIYFPGFFSSGKPLFGVKKELFFTLNLFIFNADLYSMKSSMQIFGRKVLIRMREVHNKNCLIVFILFFCAIFVISAQETTESILTRISGLLSASKYNDAIVLFDSIALPDRDSTSVRLLKASVLSSAGKYAEARTLAESICNAEPQNTDALFVLAAIESVSKRPRQQRRHLKRSSKSIRII